MEKPDWGSQIKELRKRQSLKQRELAALVGSSQPAVNAWERNRREPSAESFIKLANATQHEDLARFFTRQAERLAPGITKSLRIAAPAPVIQGAVELKVLSDKVAAGPPALINERDVEDRIAVDPSWCKHPDEAVALRISGDSMSPVLLDGWLAIVDTHPIPREQLLGEMVCAVDPGGGSTVKWLRTIMGCDGMALVPQNTSQRHPIRLLGDDWRIAGRVVCWVGQPQKRGKK